MISIRKSCREENIALNAIWGRGKEPRRKKSQNDENDKRMKEMVEMRTIIEVSIKILWKNKYAKVGRFEKYLIKGRCLSRNQIENKR